MQWIAPSEKDTATDTLEKRLWDVLVQLFGHLGLANCFAFVKKQPQVQAFMLTRDVTETPETVLHDIVELRNRASHGSVSQDQVISVQELSSYTTFVQILCSALGELVERTVLARLLQVRQVSCVGQVIHTFSNNIVGFRSCAGPIRVGERLVAKSTTAAAGATVVSVEINRQKRQEEEVAEGQEIGLQLDRKVKEGTKLLRLAPASAPKVSASQPYIPEANDYEI